ncbi:hypothetical protein TTHERM_00158440 (macronuclear) [Tetrahymena thermophila SB210]|uniref:Uncharacterized protein n=1 Tax=Tetrahymena thermophila (strain SB210) TaxID=312017 RepID=Q22W90_TETTS|nr:hypothetical protein TTHERM_00158440 [Tetrahymena thermophila SB210]EAR89527.2 hypothetical protein TTHERM_00158440 [Tetrahymena thermophila SB210]|eukprot:XP_001009772.2 hypothetical protein TTHERM_00158440 [Tetrahymena thermophila SB210]
MQQEQYLKIISQVEKQLQVLLQKKCDLLFRKFVPNSSSDELDLNQIPLQLRQFSNAERMDFMSMFNKYHEETQCQRISKKDFEKTILQHILTKNDKSFKQYLYNLVFDDDIKLIDGELKNFKQSVKVIKSDQKENKEPSYNQKQSEAAVSQHNLRISPKKICTITIDEPQNTPQYKTQEQIEQKKGFKQQQYQTNLQSEIKKEINQISNRRFSSNIMNHGQYVQGQKQNKNQVQVKQRSVSPIKRSNTRSKSPIKQSNENLGYSDIYKMKKNLQEQQKQLQQQILPPQQTQSNKLNYKYPTQSQKKLERFKQGILDNIIQQKTNSFKMNIYNNVK